MDLKEIESAMEGILFAAGEPVGVERICLALEIDRATADAVAQKLMDAYSYERRGIRLIKLDSSYQLCSAPEYAELIRKTFESRRPAKLSPPALEVLSVIAIEECGRLAVPGRPILYRTTTTFLRSFGLSSLEELPELPSAGPEDGQITLEMQAALEKLRGEQTEDLTDEELLEAARELSATEADIPAAEE